MAAEEVIQPSDPDTRQRLLEAAGPVFAERGYREATVRDICMRAGANVAAVNYHFGDKLGLYRAVFQEGYERVMTGASVTPAVAVQADPEAAIRAFVADMVERAMQCGEEGDGGTVQCLSAIMMREMIEPTAVLDDFVGRFIRPRQEFCAGAVGRMLGLPVTDPRVIKCVYSIVGQVLFYRHCREVVARLWPVGGEAAEGRKAVAEHIASFSIAGIRAMKEGRG